MPRVSQEIERVLMDIPETFEVVAMVGCNASRISITVNRDGSIEIKAGYTIPNSVTFIDLNKSKGGDNDGGVLSDN